MHFILAVLLSFSVSAKKIKFVSAYPSSVCNSTIPNTHVLSQAKGLVLRANAPIDVARKQTDYSQVIKWKITDVLVFRDVSHDPEMLSEERRELGKQSVNVHYIAFPWKEISDFKKACEQTIDALKLLSEATENSKKRYLLHCTVGEDRTGYLAGLYRVVEQSWSVQDAFEKEMCAHGYGASNPEKNHQRVVEPIRQGLTPLYIKMAYLYLQGQLKKHHLTKSICNTEPQLKAVAAQFEWLQAKNFRCKAPKTVPKAAKACTNI